MRRHLFHARRAFFTLRPLQCRSYTGTRSSPRPEYWITVQYGTVAQHANNRKGGFSNAASVACIKEAYRSPGQGAFHHDVFFLQVGKLHGSKQERNHRAERAAKEKRKQQQKRCIKPQPIIKDRPPHQQSTVNEDNNGPAAHQECVNDCIVALLSSILYCHETSKNLIRTARVK